MEYSEIKGAESCFVSFDKELNDLAGYYFGGAIMLKAMIEKASAIGFKEVVYYQTGCHGCWIWFVQEDGLRRIIKRERNSFDEDRSWFYKLLRKPKSSSRYEAYYALRDN